MREFDGVTRFENDGTIRELAWHEDRAGEACGGQSDGPRIEAIRRAFGTSKPGIPYAGIIRRYGVSIPSTCRISSGSRILRSVFPKIPRRTTNDPSQNRVIRSSLTSIVADGTDDLAFGRHLSCLPTILRRVH
jgi:hypothetical protein